MGHITYDPSNEVKFDEEIHLGIVSATYPMILL